MSLTQAMWKDILTMFKMVFGHLTRKKFVQLKIDILGKTRSRVAEMRAIMRRERILVNGLRESIYSMEDYRALVKAGYDPQ